MPTVVAIPTPAGCNTTAGTVAAGQPILPQFQVLLYSADQWEEFIKEWAHGQKAKYKDVARIGGAGDQGIDVAGFTDTSGLHGVWDNFQCKHYAHPLKPQEACGEIAKVLWHSYSGAYVAPRAYFFVAPRGCGPTLQRTLLKPGALKKLVIDKWDDYCAGAVTKKQTIDLAGPFAAYVSSFDFSIFKAKKMLELLDEHRETPYFAPRFGGGLPTRPKIGPPPVAVQQHESRYVEQLFEAYSDCRGAKITELGGLAPGLVKHFNHQREHFYHAESLRTFARDNVPPGTFEELQEEVHAGVASVEAGEHQNALVRLDAVTQTAQQLQLTANALITVTKVQDKRGICHQLANEDRLKWKQ